VEEEKEEPEPLPKTKEKYARDLRLAVRKYNPNVSTHELIAHAMGRLSLHNFLEVSLRQEEVKISQARTDMRVCLEQSTNQVIRGLVKALQNAQNELQQYRAAESARANASAGVARVLDALASEILERNARSDSASLGIFQDLVQSNVLDKANPIAESLLNVRSAVLQVDSLHSKQGFNPQEELEALHKLATARKEQLLKAQQELCAMDLRVKELKKQSAIGLRQRLEALERARAQAYCRAKEQHEADFHRLALEKDSLLWKVKELEEKVAMMRRGGT
jgi:hypothetical protein